MAHGRKGAVLAALLADLLAGPSCGGEHEPGRADHGMDRSEREFPAGLLAEYRSLNPTGPGAVLLTRIEAKPAFRLGHSSPHPRIPEGPFQATWRGYITFPDEGPIRMSAYAGGEVEVSVAGVPLLTARGESESAWVSGRPVQLAGRQDIQVAYRSLPGVPARLQLWWEGPGFAREPVPAWCLAHDPETVPDAARGEDLVERGRSAVARLGCARCHADAFPSLRDEPAPGPVLGDLQGMRRAWLIRWLEDPRALRSHARMPRLFQAGRAGLVERWVVADHLLAGAGPATKPAKRGDHRAGRRAFLGRGCFACHRAPDQTDATPDPERPPLDDLGARMTRSALAAFLANPLARYPEHPAIPLTEKETRDIAAFLLMWTEKPVLPPVPQVAPHEIESLRQRLGLSDDEAPGAALVREKGCARCHAGLGEPRVAAIPIASSGASRGCLADGAPLPKFSLNESTRRAILAYTRVAPLETHPSAFHARQRLLQRLACHRCHQGEEERAAPLEEIGRTQWSSLLYRLPNQRPPRLVHPSQHFTGAYLAKTIRSGQSGVRPSWYSYRMPAYGKLTDTIVRALAERDGSLPAAPASSNTGPPASGIADSTLETFGPTLAGFSGYACVACHLWKGKNLTEVDPGAVGPELTGLNTRMRREWFDRWLADPERMHPGTVMPAVFTEGAKARIGSVLGGDGSRQKDALWAYFAMGAGAPDPRRRDPLPIDPPGGGNIVAQIPIRLPGGSLVESVCVATATHDVLVYDIGKGTLSALYLGARILRHPNGGRSYHLTGTRVKLDKAEGNPIRLRGPTGTETAAARRFDGYDRLAGGVRIRSTLSFPSARIRVLETFHMPDTTGRRSLVRELEFEDVPEGLSVGGADPRVSAEWKLPPAKVPANPRTVLTESIPVADPPDLALGSERPGYRLLRYPRPKTAQGEDLIMPSALAVDPRDGRLFVASLKLGQILVLEDPKDNGKRARFVDHTLGLFQDAYGMLHDGDALYAVVRRGLIRIRDLDRDGRADRVDRLFTFPHAVAHEYDWGYGLVRDSGGAFLVHFAPHANHHLPGSGNVMRYPPRGGKPGRIAYGLRNAYGWCTGPGGEVFFTDNQGEWVATNKLCHLVEGRFYGYPNRAQPEHRKKPRGKAAVWVPYGWAKSLNGVTHDKTGGKFGPFAGQFFIAELMHGGAIIRACLERVNGVYQGACFPFWGRGLLGPLVLAFDKEGRLFVGGITMPGWMGQPDRGALFRIDFTGETPFEVQSIRVRPRGFRLRFTRAVTKETADATGSYGIERYRYEYTGAYGSPELDRTPVGIERVVVAEDGRTVELTTSSLRAGWVYSIDAGGVRSARDEPLLHPVGVYTLNEIPER